MENKEEKYYTPGIEEFHVGFEYEYRRHQTDYDWQATQIRGAVQITDVHVSYRGTRVYDVRVKKLDHDDIVECGWKEGVQYGSERRYEKGNTWALGGAFLTHDNNNGRLIITSVDAGFNADGPNHSVKFNGTIRNKSELKMIMKMVGI